MIIYCTVLLQLGVDADIILHKDVKVYYWSKTL